MQNCCPEFLSTAVVTLSNVIAKDLTVAELGQLALIFSLMSSTLGIIAASRGLCSGNPEDIELV
ncbi:MAG: hypothetical protein RR540_03150 [Oscillospiraceae bacterium]